ncbi:MAG: ATP-binding protein [Oscillospiraceae bacterium]|nr:ATP-binding protein [Oscillospiraceae bacterium]
MKKSRPIKKIQQEILRTLMILVSIMTVLIAVISIIVNVRSESKRIDQNLENIAQAIARSQIVQEELSSDNKQQSFSAMQPYLESLKESLTNIDVISVIDADGIRRFHSNDELTDSIYDGTIPTFQNHKNRIYVTSDVGPSGSQRRAYAAIYDENGNYLGFVLAVMLNQNIHRTILNTVVIHLVCAVAVIFCAVILSKHLSGKIKRLLLGYEPDTFSAMFSVRENILESLDEGILAVDTDEKIIFINKAAKNILHIQAEHIEGDKINEISPVLSIKRTLTSGEKYLGITVHPKQDTDVLVDQIPVMEQDSIVGALCILRDRTEYTKMMEDLSGVRYMVESMRANNHDFINKLHVILGLIQMGNVKEASEYIAHITAIQQTLIHNIMKNIEDPSVAALLIGKNARAAELNIRFTLKSGSKLSRNDISLLSGDLVTIIGNLLDNAMDSMNKNTNFPKELSVGLFTKPHAMLISVDDTGTGISPENQKLIFENGFSTKGDGRGTGLFVVNNLIKKYGGSISVESEPDAGTSFTVTLTDER